MVVDQWPQWNCLLLRPQNNDLVSPHFYIHLILIVYKDKHFMQKICLDEYYLILLKIVFGIPMICDCYAKTRKIF